MDNTENDYVEFQIGVDAIPIPLGWQLASSTRQALVAQLKRPPDCWARTGIVNGCSVQDVVDIIRSVSVDPAASAVHPRAARTAPR